MVELTHERDLDTLRHISLLLDRENQRLIEKNLQLTAELARLRGENPEQLTLATLRELQQARERVWRVDEQLASSISTTRTPRPGHGPRPQPTLPTIEIRHELPPDQRQCPACGGELTEMIGQAEVSDRITTVKLTYQVEHHVRQKYRCGCNGAVVTAPGPAQMISGGRYTPEFAVGVAVAKYTDHLPLERQVRMMAREGLILESQTLWDQLNAMARHLEPTYVALGRRALDASVINVDETRWAIMGSAKAAAGTVWGVHAPAVAFYRILPGKSADEGRKILGNYRGTMVADGFAVYDVLARDGPGFTLAHCWAHAKRKYDDIVEQWPSACAEIGALIRELYAIERLVPGPFPGDAAAQALRQQLRQERSKPLLDRIWQWATVQVGLPRSDFGKAVRYMLERWEGLTRFVDDPRVPLDNNAAERALRGPVVGRKNHYGSRSLRGTQVARFSTRSARPPSWSASIPTPTCSGRSTRQSHGLERSPFRKISSARRTLGRILRIPRRLHAADEWIPQKGRKPRGDGGSILHVLQLRPGASDAPRDAGIVDHVWALEELVELLG